MTLRVPRNTEWGAALCSCYKMVMTDNDSLNSNKMCILMADGSPSRSETVGPGACNGPDVASAFFSFAWVYQHTFFLYCLRFLCIFVFASGCLELFCFPPLFFLLRFVCFKADNCCRVN